MNAHVQCCSDVANLLPVTNTADWRVIFLRWLHFANSQRATSSNSLVNLNSFYCNILFEGTFLPICAESAAKPQSNQSFFLSSGLHNTFKHNDTVACLTGVHYVVCRFCVHSLYSWATAFNTGVFFPIRCYSSYWHSRNIYTERERERDSGFFNPVVSCVLYFRLSLTAELSLAYYCLEDKSAVDWLTSYYILCVERIITRHHICTFTASLLFSRSFPDNTFEVTCVTIEHRNAVLSLNFTVTNSFGDTWRRHNIGQNKLGYHTFCVFCWRLFS